MLLVRSKLNSIQVLFSNTLTDSNVSHDELVFKKSTLKEYDDMKEEIKNSSKNNFLNILQN